MSIQWKELFAIVTAACTWGHLLQGQPINVHCDNMAIVQSWSDQSARHPGILHLLRTLFFVTAKHSFIVRLVHLPGKLNQISDALSRNQLSLFSALAPRANLQPTHQYLPSWQSSKPSDGEAPQQSTGPIHFHHLPDWYQEVL